MSALSTGSVERYAVAIVSVPPAGDTHAIATELDHDPGFDVTTIVTTVDTGSVIADLTADQLIRKRGIPTAAEDGRAIAEVVVRQFESATAVILSSDEPGPRSNGTPSTATARRTSHSPAPRWTSGNYGSASTVVFSVRTKRSTP